jgi:MFS family permease
VSGLVTLIPVSTALFGLALIGFSFSRYFPLSLILLAIVGFGMMMQMASSNTIVQTIVDDKMRGRVMSFYTMAFMGTAPFGSLLAGTFAKYIGAPVTLVIGGTVCILAALIYAQRLPEMHNQLRSDYVSRGLSQDETSNPL